MAAFFVLKILFTTHQGGLAGSTMSVTYLARGLAGRGHEIHVACDQNALLWKNLENDEGVTLHHVRFRSYLDLRAIGAIQDIVKDYHIEMINAQGGIDRNLVILAKWLGNLRCKVVFTRRQRPRDEPWIKRWFHTRGTEKIVLVSEGLRDIFVAKGYSEDHLMVIHNGVPSDLIKPETAESLQKMKSELGIEGEVIGCLSRAKIQKEIIESLQYLPSDYRVLFVGITETEIKSALDLFKPKQHLVFTGPLPHTEALKYLQLMDVNVLASHMDGFGLVLVEAMLSGVPVIGSDYGGIPDVIQHGVNGFLFQNGNHSQLAGYIHEICTNKDLKEKLITQGKKLALSKFTMGRVIDDYERLFKDLTD